MNLIESGVRRQRTVVGLDLLRLCAALFVVIYHIYFFSWVEKLGDGGLHDAVGVTVRFPEMVPYCSWGWIGVDLFFVISGFVITMSARGKSPFEFAVGRFSRLFPALLFFSCLIFCFVVYAHLLPVDMALMRLLRTLVLFPQGPWIDGLIWTLTIEIIFYGLIFLSRFRPHQNLVSSVSSWTLMALLIFWSAVFLQNLTGDLGHLGSLLNKVAAAYWARVALISTAPFFLLGMFSFEIFDRGISARRLLSLLGAALCGLYIVYNTALSTEGITEFHQSALIPMFVWFGMIAICGLSLIIESRYTPNANLRAIARRLGLLTYPLYLVHDIPGGVVLGALFRAGMNRWLAATIVLLLAVGAAQLFILKIEPGLRRVLDISPLAAWYQWIVRPKSFRRWWIGCFILPMRALKRRLS